MPFRIIRNDITRVTADAIVNTANPHATIGSGTDSAIYQAAGMEELLRARKAIGDIRPGDVQETPAFRLHARYILHTVGPVWIDGHHHEREILRSCYDRCLQLAKHLSCQSIAFPLISTGSYGFPRDEALQIALDAFQRFLLKDDMDITLVVFHRSSLVLSQRLQEEIESFIDDFEVQRLTQEEYGTASPPLRRVRQLRIQEAAECQSPAPDAVPEASEEMPDDLDSVIASAGPTFQQRLFQLIDARGLDDVDVYKAANIDRKVFSKIRCNAHYQPSKPTAVAFCIALRLSMEEMMDLLSRAGLAFSPSNRFDLIIRFFVGRGIYDMLTINAALFKYDQPCLGPYSE